MSQAIETVGDLSPVVQNIIFQETLFGTPLDTISATHNVPVALIEEIVLQKNAFSNPARKRVALARLDRIAAAVIGPAANGDITAINTYLKIQERESKLAGLDTQTEDRVKLVLDIPWLSQERLSYKHGGPVQDNVVDITPVLEAKSKALVEPTDGASTVLPPTMPDGSWKETDYPR